MVLTYFHFRILEFPLNMFCLSKKHKYMKHVVITIIHWDSKCHCIKINKIINKSHVTILKKNNFITTLGSQLSNNHTMWGPQYSYISWCITPITMIYGTYNYSYWGESKPTNTTGGPNIVLYCTISPYFWWLKPSWFDDIHQPTRGWFRSPCS